MSRRAIPFVLTLPGYGWASEGSHLSAVRDWATSKVLAHARRVGCRVLDIHGWDYTAVDEDGAPAVALVAVLAPLPTIADAVQALRDRPARAHREHACLLCREIRRLRACDFDDDTIARRLELHSGSAVRRHIDNHGGAA